MGKHFPILGTKTPEMLGREDILQNLFNELTKPTPSHISIVGPRFSGKSVILNGLIKKLNEQDSPFCGISYWDLGHQTPLSDEDFFHLMAYNLGNCLEKVDPEYGEYLKDKGAGYGEIREVIKALELNQQMVLMLWDGFDKPLGSGNLTRNLWDNLLNLCRQPGLRVVTCTRKELHKLIRDEQSVTSDFWGIFDGVSRVGVFEEKDIEEIIKVKAGLQLSAGARSELMNWTSGFPPLFLGLLNNILDAHDQGEVDNDAVNQAAGNACDKYSAILSRMWDDCTPSAQDLYVYLNKSGMTPVSEAGKSESRELVEKGFAREAGSKLFPGCRMLREYVRQEEPDIGSMARLFGSWESYRKNIRDLLQRRLSHIPRFDDRLFRLVEMAIKDIPEYPDYCLNNLTGIRDRALHLIWEREFGEGKKVPVEVVRYWTINPRSEHGMVKGMMNSDCWDVPADPLDQIRLLSLLTGSYRNFEARAKSVSKDSYVLIDAVHTFRNRAQHPDGQSIRVGVAAAALMACIELLACLEREIGN
ncbi:hypothetical protein [Desulfonatronospira sp.]|uniref:hypothetical protein n=1 Tax=Desulfonatronospira sp. TaxID=1962951 RepID=UPI0025B9DEF4|nr:hypothetical protein [Desulfonatronospira sp.]